MGIVEDSFADRDFGPNEVAAETGISLSYLQELVTERGSTYCDFILGSFRPRRAPCGSSSIVGKKSASERDRLRLRLSRLYPFRTSFDIGSVTPQASTQENLTAQAIVRARTGESAP
jgi:hypothetical protein